jgi:glutamine amidotransferase
MTSIRAQGIDEALAQALEQGKSRILGICLGMQLLMASSVEDGGAMGLGIVEGAIGRFSADLKVPVPHIGFNSVLAPQESVLFAGLPEETDFYFVHSYRASTLDSVGRVATSFYGEMFVSAFEVGNVYGTQFHPEKSQSNGLRLLSNALSADIR